MGRNIASVSECCWAVGCSVSLACRDVERQAFVFQLIVLHVALCDRRLIKPYYFDNTCSGKPSISWSCSREKFCSLSGLLKSLAALVTRL